MPPALHARGLGLRFGPRALFAGLTFSVHAGEALAVVGPNGSGKSSLLRVLAGVLAPSAGEVALEAGGRAVPSEQVPRHTGYVAPYLQLYEPLSGAENLDFLVRAHGLDRRAERVPEALERVGLGGRGGDLVRTYSTGMRQRLRLAAALLHAPPLLLLDEPSATLDAAGRALVAEVVAQPGRVVVLATNEPAEADLCPRRLTLA